MTVADHANTEHTRCGSCGLRDGDHTVWCRASVTAADHANTAAELAATVREALPGEPENHPDTCRCRSCQATDALDALVAQCEAFHRHVETIIEPKLLARAEAAETERGRLNRYIDLYILDVERLREALEEIERAAKVGITQKNRLPDLVGILATARAALATDRTEARDE